MLTVRELLFESGLPVRLVGGESGLGRSVEGIHLSDLPDPVPWMTRGMVLLTAGPSFASEPREGVNLLDRLASIDGAALGVSVGHHMKTVPRAVIERAETLHIPVFEIAPGVPMRTVISYVNESLASTDLHRLRRTVAVHHRLLELVAEERGVQELLSNVAALLEMPMVVFDGRGAVVASAGAEAEGLCGRMWEAYAGAGDSAGPAGTVEDGRARIYYREATLFGRLERVLVARAEPIPSSEFIEAALTFLQRLVTLDLLRARDALSAERRARARLLQDFISGLGPLESLTEQIERQGLDLQRPWRLAVCEARDQDHHPGASPNGSDGHQAAEAMVEAAEAFFLGRHIRFLAAASHSSAILLFSLEDAGPAAARDCMERLGAAAQTATGGAPPAVGCSSALSTPDDGRRSLRQAQEALMVTRQQGFGSIVLFDELSGLVRLLAQLGDETLRAVLEETVTPLADWDAARHTELVRTLEVLFENRLGMQDTAVALGVHRNTLQKRLRRIEQLLGVDLDQLDDLLQLHLGLRAAELLQASRQGGDPTF
jgi:purine catabolism regulator